MTINFHLWHCSWLKCVVWLDIAVFCLSSYGITCQSTVLLSSQTDMQILVRKVWWKIHLWLICNYCLHWQHYKYSIYSCNYRVITIWHVYVSLALNSVTFVLVAHILQLKISNNPLIRCTHTFWACRQGQNLHKPIWVCCSRHVILHSNHYHNNYNPEGCCNI